METDPKPGVQTSEFWMAVGSYVGAFITAMSNTDDTAKWTTGVIAFAMTLKYLYGRWRLKMDAAEAARLAERAKAFTEAAKAQTPPKLPPGFSGGASAILLAALSLLAFAAPAFAQPPPHQTVTWTHLLAYRDNQNQRLALLELQIRNQQMQQQQPPQIIQQQAPAAPQFIMMPGQQQQCPPDRSAEVTALQGQVSQLNSIISQLQLQQRAPQMMQQPLVQQMQGPNTMYHYHWYMGPNGQPMVQGPFSAPPQQQQLPTLPQQISLPIQQGPPLQQLPIQQQAPLQILPIQQGPPLQVLPIQQNAPLQILPQQSAPPLQILPIQTLPPQQQILPIQQSPPQIQLLPIQQQQNGPTPLPIQQKPPQMPAVPQNANGPPTGFQRFTAGGLQLQDPLGRQAVPGQNYQQPPTISSYRTYERKTP